MSAGLKLHVSNSFHSEISASLFSAPHLKASKLNKRQTAGALRLSTGHLFLNGIYIYTSLKKLGTSASSKSSNSPQLNTILQKFHEMISGKTFSNMVCQIFTIFCRSRFINSEYSCSGPPTFKSGSWKLRFS